VDRIPSGSDHVARFSYFQRGDTLEIFNDDIVAQSCWSSIPVDFLDSSFKPGIHDKI